MRAVCCGNRGDWGSLGHGLQWDNPYIGNSKKENAIMIISNKCQRNPRFCFLSRRNLYSSESSEKKVTFSTLVVILFPCFVLWNRFVELMSF